MVKGKNIFGSFIFLIKIAFRNIFRNTRRSALSLAAVSFAVLLIIFFIAFIEGMMDSIKIIAITFETGHIRISTKDYEKDEIFMPVQYPIDNPDYYYEELSKIKGVKKITSRIMAYGTFTNSKIKHGIIAGIDPDDIINSENDAIKYGYYNFTKKNNGLLKGKYPDNNENECAIGYRLAKKMEIIWPVFEKNEFEWILENIKNDEALLMKESYNFDSSLNVYRINLFNYKDLPKKEIKKTSKAEKEKYLNLLNLFINIEIKKLPDKIGKYANAIEYMFMYDYMKEAFLKNYRLDEENDAYDIISGNNTFNEELLEYFKSSYELRVPFKIISSQYSDRYADPKVVGIFEYDYVTVDQSMVIIPYSKMQRLAALRNKTQNIFLYTENINNIDNIKKEMNSKLNNSNLVYKDWTQFPMIALFKSFEFIYNIIYAIFLIVASFLIINTILMVIHERIKEIGMMGALGMKREEIVFVFFLEALFLSILGAFLGTFLGGIATYSLSLMPISTEILTGGVEFPMTNTIYVKFSYMILLFGFLFGSILTAVCTILPSIKSAFIEPVEALRR